jgi:L-2,4-diaminobutyrate decarboxylase
VIDRVLADLEADATVLAGLEFVRTAADFIAENASGSPAVAPAVSPDVIAECFDEPIPRSGRPLADVVARLRHDVLAHSIRLSHPMYLGHQVSAPLAAPVWAETIASVANNSLAVREMSPAGTALEHRVVRWCAELAGYGGQAGGTFTSGGTEATFTALLAARAAAMPDAWENGVGNDPPVIVCGEHAHYAVTRAAGELGLGMSRAIVVPSREWRMDTAALESTLDELAGSGRGIMAVVATAGSTATGSFDDLDVIGRLCESRGIWLHLDAAHGASALLSERHRFRLRGLQRARSIAWDPHKMMLVPLSAGMVLVRDERDLDLAFAQRAPYLFHAAEGRNPDQGIRSFQCSRRFDALKVWTALQRYGADGIGALYDHLCDLTMELYRTVREHPAFEAMHEPESNILCFRAVGMDNGRLRERYNASGRGWITSTLLAGERVLRVTVMNPRTTTRHVRALVDGLATAIG